MSVTFPDGFLWGAATSAYQVEGGAASRGPSIWDTFAERPGRTHHGDTGLVACDHFGRLDEDLDLMAAMGLTSYRFSVSWPRVMAGGIGFYSRLVDGLLERGIEPMLTLYHWDLPEVFHARGGWLERSIVDVFADHAATVCDALGDRVRLWTTLNEPWVAGMLGYGTTALAPGLGDGTAALRATHHLLLAHGRAANVLRGSTSSGTARSIGLALNLSPMVPATGSPEDAAAATRFDGYVNRWFLNPIFHKAYPESLRSWSAHALEGVVQDGDLAEIATPLDFLGVNYYCRMHIASGDTPDPLAPRPSLDAHQVAPAGVETTAMGWPIEPDGLFEILTRLRADHPNLPPIYLTENGAAFHDYTDPTGRVRDPERIAYLRGHLLALHRAIARGVDVRGYFCWSLLDNFEWHHGFSKRFGLTHVDFATGRRTLKDSAHWYAGVIRDNGLRT